MPRRRRVARALPEVPSLGGEPGNPADPRAERVAVFEKTKMCKFYILGACTKGATCHFAHDKEDLKGLPDLTRTKLCKGLINTGQCDDPECTYAHTRDELRPTPVPDAIPKRQQRQLLHEMVASQRHQGQQMPQTPPQQPQQPPLQIPQHHILPQQQPQPMQQRQPQQQQPVPQQSQPQQQQSPLLQPAMDPRSQQQALAAATAATAATAAGAAPMPCAVPGMAFLANSQDPALVQQYTSLLQQMGQAAQAHALEAARLQAMAMQMQSGVGTTATGAVPANAARIMPYFMLNGGGAGFGFDPQALMLPQMVQLQGQTMAAAGAMPAAGGMTIPGQEPYGATAPQTQPSTFGQPPQSSQDAQDEDNPRILAAAMSRVLGNEPVQIRTETLRSMSSNSLCRMAPPEEEDEPISEDEPSRGGASGMTSTRAPSSAVGSKAAAAEKRSQDTPLGAPHMVSEAGEGHEGSSKSFGTKGFDKSAITIKNTFVDIASPAVAVLRSVRTYGGSLSLMGRQSSGNALDILDE